MNGLTKDQSYCEQPRMGQSSFPIQDSKRCWIWIRGVKSEHTKYPVKMVRGKLMIVARVSRRLKQFRFFFVFFLSDQGKK